MLTVLSLCLRKYCVIIKASNSYRNFAGLYYLHYISGRNDGVGIRNGATARLLLPSAAGYLGGRPHPTDGERYLQAQQLVTTLRPPVNECLGPILFSHLILLLYPADLI